ncbi:hypothetical protein HMPREF9404_4439 [Eggerthella sp. HGA1]|nr:hypothetical protein HMPREF9404_4439 [Eggerthella sp. HGA1]
MLFPSHVFRALAEIARYARFCARIAEADQRFLRDDVLVTRKNRA